MLSQRQAPTAVTPVSVVTGSKRTVKLSVVVTNVVNITYKELDELITNMASQTGTLRTQKLRQFCHRAMKRLAQLLALCKWLANPDVVVYLNDISTLQQHMQEIEIELKKMQDSLYWAHAGLYSKRFHALEVKTAQDLLAREKIANMPKQMMLYVPENEDKIQAWYKDLYSDKTICNVNDSTGQLAVMATTPSVDDNRSIAAEKLALQLNNFIKFKCIYGEHLDMCDSPIRTDSSVATHVGKKRTHLDTTNTSDTTEMNIVVVRNGKLIITVMGYYRLTLTLRYLSDSAPWKFIDFEFLVRSHQSEFLEQNVIFLEEMKASLVAALRNACECDRLRSSVGSGVSGGDDAAAAAGVNINKQPAGSQILKPTAGLNALLSLCQYAATAVLLRYIFLQGINHNRLIGQRQMEIVYYERTNPKFSSSAKGGSSAVVIGGEKNVPKSGALSAVGTGGAVYDASVCRLKFWKDSAVEGGFRYIIEIKQLRNIVDVMNQYTNSPVDSADIIPAATLKSELALVVELHEFTGDGDSSSSSSSSGNKPRIIPVDMFAPGLRTLRGIYASGVSFQLFKDHIMELCSSTKLMYIYCYIRFLYKSHCEAVVKATSSSRSTSTSNNDDLNEFDPSMVSFELFPSTDSPSEVHIIFDNMKIGHDSHQGQQQQQQQQHMDSSRIVLAVDRLDGRFVIYTNNCVPGMSQHRRTVMHQLCETLKYELNSNQNLIVRGNSGTTGIHRNARNYLYWLKTEPREAKVTGDVSTTDMESCDSSGTGSSNENSIANGDIFVQLTELPYFYDIDGSGTSVKSASSSAAATVGSTGASTDTILSKYSLVKNSVLWCVLTLHECVTLKV